MGSALALSSSMESFKSILVDVDSSAAVHPALERALRLARRSKAKVTITDVITVPDYARRYLPAGLEEEMVSLRRHELSRIAHAVTDVCTEFKLLVGRPGTVLIQEVLRSNHDLLMRSHARAHTAKRRRPFGAVDMELLRKCPCPVFLVQHGVVHERPLITGAVNASTENESERVLNVKIVELTLLLAEMEGGKPILLQAWAPFGERVVRSHASDEAFTAFVQNVRQSTAADLKQLAQSFGERLSKAQTINRRGTPEDVIPQFVVSKGIDVVVMGTLARAGIAGFLIGNTAERVLRTLPCSVLAVKPDGFVSPVSLDAV